MVKLFEHNEIGYKELVNALKVYNMTTLNRATGTGKSFIILKYLYEYCRSKRILYICPTYYIFNQLVNDHMSVLGMSIDDFNIFDNIIFQNILKLDMEELVKYYDIIIVDEFHRSGAKKWWKKLRELRDLIISKYINVTLIGLTATDKRYLDNNRNMTDEMFFGNCASSLSLCDAILQGILPAPTYINCPYFCFEKLDKLPKKVDNKVFYDSDKQYFYSIINRIKTNIDDKTIKIFKENIREDGKYIVFNSTIESIVENKLRIKNWFKDYEVEFLEVHSLESRIQNEKVLEKFSKSTGKLTFLFVVDILNEGIHVKGVNGIIMFRHTISPIIYFQQLGRLLSFSSRKDKLVVLDMVDNLNSNDVMKDLYNDVIRDAKNLIVNDSEHFDRYQTILDNLKIVDDAISLIKEVDKLEKMLSTENILRRRVESAICILESNFDEIECIQAYIDLLKFSDYVSEDQYFRLVNLNIRDVIFDQNYDFFKSKGECLDLYEAKFACSLSLFKSFCEFCKNNKRLPSAISGNNLEATIAFYINSDDMIFTKENKRIFLNLRSKYYPSNDFEQIFYGLNSEANDEQVFLFIKRYLECWNKLNKNLRIFLWKNRSKINLAEYSYIINSKDNMIDFFNKYGRLPKFYISNKDELKLFLNIMLDNVLKNNQLNQEFYEMYINIEEIIDKLNKFIEEHKRYPLKSNDDEGEVYNLLKKYNRILEKFGFLKFFDQMLNRNTKDKYLDSLISFIHEHDGELPTLHSAYESEVYLASQFSLYTSSYFDENEKLYIKEEIKKLRVDNDFLQKYIIFLKKYKRYPNKNSSDADEVDLAIRYLRNEPYFTLEEKKKISSAVKVSRRDLFRNTYFSNK